MDNNLDWWYEDDTRSSKERMKNNPNAPKWIPTQFRIYDQILAVTKKLTDQIEVEDDEFFNNRPFLADDFTKEMRKKSGMDMSTKENTNKTKLPVLINELNLLWDEFEEMEIQRKLNQ